MISVVVPTLNAAAGLPRCFESLIPAALRGLVREVIVADGGSTDDTRAIADVAGARVVEAERGRGTQLAVGAMAARSDWLLFLHADTVLALGWEGEVASFIEQSTLEKPCAAAFRFALDDPRWRARILERLVWLRCRLFALAYGDQGLLIPRRLYQMIGGYRPMPLTEDVDMVRRIGRRRLVFLQARAITSAARFHERSYVRRSARNLAILILYALRVPVRVLAALYD
jgi:rSAM/selenodomain-associated transferase 2